MTRSSVNFNSAGVWQTGCRICSAAKFRICRESKNCIVAALDIGNKSVHKGRSKSIGGAVSAAANAKNASVRWIATRICQQGIRQSIITNSTATANNELVIESLRAPRKTKLRSEVF